MTSPKLQITPRRHGDLATIAKALGVSQVFIGYVANLPKERQEAATELVELAAHNRAEFEVRLALYTAKFSQPDEHEGRAV
jgi:hypothetical protein